jgi:NDP-sugar pyrophosphorylase family protein
MGYLHPKPLILAQGRPILSYVIDNIKTLDGGKAIFIFQREHEKVYQISDYVRSLYPNSEFVFLDGLTDGAARTVNYGLYKLEELGLLNDPVIVLNSDQYVSNPDVLTKFKADCTADGNILCFRSSNPKWSFAQLKWGKVVKVAEKQPISKNATLGIYYYKSGLMLQRAIRYMIDAQKKVRDEFYLCPAYNEMIELGKKITITQMKAGDKWGLGTPEDLEYFNKNFKGNYETPLLP